MDTRKNVEQEEAREKLCRVIRECAAAGLAWPEILRILAQQADQERHAGDSRSDPPTKAS